MINRFKIAVSALLVICFLYIFALYSIQVHIHKDKRSLCSAVSPLLTGSTGVNFEDGGERANWPPTLKEIDKEHQHLKLGGYYPGPRSCVPRSTVAVILPYRDRDIHLRFQLHYLHGILYRQQTRYVIIVAEQIGSDIFNKGQLMNTAFNYVVNDLDLKVDCVFFHDVDSISEDDRTLYECKDDRHVVHLSHRMDKFNYRFCCGVTIGGVLGMSPAQFHSVNGFSNVYSGWGGEDDDMDARIKQIGKYEIYRPNEEENTYSMIHHQKDNDNPYNDYGRRLFIRWRTRQPHDGLNSLETQVVSVVRHPTHLRLNIQTKHINIDDWLSDEAT